MRLLCCSLLLLLVGCSESSDPENYFPLEKGISWEYRVTLERGEETQRSEFSITNLGAVELQGEWQDIPVFLRRTSDGTDFYIRQDDAGTERIAKRTVVELKPRFDVEPRKVLPGNPDIETGRNWITETRSYVIRSVPAYALSDPAIKPLAMNYEITAVNEQIEVPAGVFKSCVKVEGEAVLSLYADARLGYLDIPIRQTEWYAPGVGLVKLVREEPLEVEMFQGGRISFELSEWSAEIF